jgi:uncharacterized protein
MNNLKLIDSSFLYAIFNSKDHNHASAVDFLSKNQFTLSVPDVVLPEVAFLFIRDVGYDAVGKFLTGLASAKVSYLPLINPDVERASQIMKAYPNAKFDLVDTCIMALAERLDITQVCTFDRRDFGIYRPTHCEHLELLP